LILLLMRFVIVMLNIQSGLTLTVNAAFTAQCINLCAFHHVHNML